MAAPAFTDEVAFTAYPLGAFSDLALAVYPGVYLRLGDTVGSPTAADASGNGNTGTVVTGGVTFGTAGLLSGDTDTAATVDGSVGHLLVQTSPSWRPTTALSVGFWIKPSSVSGTFDIAYAKTGASKVLFELAFTSSQLLYIGVDSGGTSFGTGAGGVSIPLNLGAAGIAAGSAYFVVLTDDGSSAANAQGLNLYINGVRVDTQSRPANAGGFQDTDTTLLLATNDFTQNYQGVLDEFFAVPNTVLTAAQISQLYQARGGTPTSQIAWTTLAGRPGPIGAMRGKIHELDQMQAGTADSVLKNLDRALDPTNTSSTYWPNVQPIKRFRRRATINSTTYNVFTGYATGWPQTRVGPNYAEVQLKAVDAFEAFTNAIIAGSLPQELSGSRIKRILNLTGWSQTDRNIDAGSSLMQAVTFTAASKKTALSHLLDVASWERGLFFIAGNGQATFIDRHSLLTSPYNTSQATFSDSPAGGEFGYQNIVTSYDRDQIWNDWTDSRTGGTAQNSQDAASIQSYFRRSQSLTSELTSDAESLYLTQWLLALYKNPLFRIESITLRPGNATSFWQAVLAREIGDRITVKGSPPGGGPQFVKNCLISQSDIRVPKHAADTTVTWQLVSADTMNFLVLNDPVQGQLDANAVAW